MNWNIREQIYRFICTCRMGGLNLEGGVLIGPSLVCSPVISFWQYPWGWWWRQHCIRRRTLRRLGWPRQALGAEGWYWLRKLSILKEKDTTRMMWIQSKLDQSCTCDTIWSYACITAKMLHCRFTVKLILCDFDQIEGYLLVYKLAHFFNFLRD